MSRYHIGDIARTLRISVDALRYYERIGLLGPVARTPSGIRIYDDADISRLRFIQRAQLMNFSLSEIGLLLEFRKNPPRSRKKVRALATAKLAEIDARLRSLEALREELGRLVKECRASAEGCAIITGIEHREPAARRGETSGAG